MNALPSCFKIVEDAPTYVICELLQGLSIENAMQELKKSNYDFNIIFGDNVQFRIVSAAHKAFEAQALTEAKAGLVYNDEMSEETASKYYVIHMTSTGSWQKISDQGRILCRNEAKTNTCLSVGKSDGDTVYTQAVLKEVLPSIEREMPPDTVMIVMDHKLLLRKDYYASASWCYGPFGRGSRYYGPEFREKDPRYKTSVEKDDVITDINTFFKSSKFGVHDGGDREGTNEVGFKNPINIKDHLVKIVSAPPKG